MFKRRCDEKITTELYSAIKKGNLKKVKELVENENATITMFAYAWAVEYKQIKILQYFLEKDSKDSFYALTQAIKEDNEEFIKIIINYWKNNKQSCEFDLDSEIIYAIQVVIKEYKSVPQQITIPDLESKALQKIRFILKTYDE